MPHLIQITPVKTYKTPENAKVAVEKKCPAEACRNLRYVIMPHTDGRFFPVFIGQECLRYGIQFEFNVIG